MNSIKRLTAAIEQLAAAVEKRSAPISCTSGLPAETGPEAVIPVFGKAEQATTKEIGSEEILSRVSDLFMKIFAKESPVAEEIIIFPELAKLLLDYCGEDGCITVGRVHNQS